MILVLGSTGLVGGMIARNLLERGEEVRVLLRDASQHPLFRHDGVRVCFGDLKEPATIADACRGAATVVTTANSAARGGEDNVDTVDRAGNRTLIDAAVDAGVAQFVFVSAQVADPESPVPLFRAKAETDAYLMQSGLPYTILAPNAFMDVWVAIVVGGPAMVGRPVTLVGQGERKHSFIAARDVAAFASAVIGHDHAVNRRIVLGGPEAVSFVDAANIYSRVLERDVEIQTVPIGSPVPGLPPFINEALPAFEFFDSPVPMEETAATFGVTLTTLESMIREQVSAT